MLEEQNNNKLMSSSLTVINSLCIAYSVILCVKSQHKMVILNSLYRIYKAYNEMKKEKQIVFELQYIHSIYMIVF